MGRAAFHLKADGVKRLAASVTQRKRLLICATRIAAVAGWWCGAALLWAGFLQIAQQLTSVGVLRRADEIRRDALFLNFSVAKKKNQQPVGTARRQRQIVVTSSTAVPDSRRRYRGGRECVFCTVTSRALVGSSAMIRSGFRAMAIAINTRCFMPPELRGY